ncbi:DUF2092 domain-containing protein [Paraburkholderia unamae]|uniref:DUF2092 domain-containing protein n=1 Tax=Paraburkholderia unamae TaxID=219649 RepID=A0ABX5K5X6_9BURK|nr:DUF2092 domain-containing protein [Paraburkholderia unamae]PVX60002.1 hypothetical protein C7402_14926 [Paraburkholderia unamae]
MKKRALSIAMLAATLIAPHVGAQTASAPAASSEAVAVDPAAVDALHKMGTALQSLKRFSVTTQLTGERVLEDGQKLQHTATAVLDVDRPNRIRAIMTSARSHREIVFDGKNVTLYTPAQKYYATTAFTGNIQALIDKLGERYGVEVPLADLFVWGTPQAPNDQFESAMFAGQDYVGYDLCDHYAFRQKNVDWQIWITTGEQPLPRKIVITRRDDDARPQSVSVIDWTLHPDFKDTIFTFKPPSGAKKIDFVPVAAKKG